MDNTDCETGESIPNTHHGDDMSMANLFDSETGEMDGCPTETLILMRKTRFSVPKELIKAPANKSNCCMDSHDTFTLSKKEEVINLQEEIILGCNKTSHRLFLFPSFLLFTSIWAPLMFIVELYLHISAHRKNARNTNNTLYYRSPLHIITAQFCASCRNHADMKCVSKLQDKRQKNWQQHLRDMARSVY